VLKGAMTIPAAARGALLLAALAARAALATTAADLCPASADPCNVSSAVRVDPGSTIDVGARRLVIHPDGSLAVGSGLMTIRCGSLVVQAGGALLARGQVDGGSIVVTASGDIRVAASDSAQGQIDASAASDPGDVSLSAGGDVAIGGQVTAQATAAAGDGGSVTVSAGDGVVLTGRIGVGGGTGGGGGTASIDARRDVAIDGPIDASGGETDGGSIDVQAGGNLVTGSTEAVDVSGGGLSGSGGDASFLARGATLAIGGTVLGRAAGSNEEGGGDGGSFSASAPAGALRVDGKILMPGAAPDGAGGDAELDAGVSLVATGTLSTSAPGDGGLLQLVSPTLSVEGTLDASSPGGGGIVVLAACTLGVPASGKVTTQGSSGSNLLEASGVMTVAGSLLSGPPGVNELDYLDPATPPVLAGATIGPAPKLVVKSRLPVSCSVAVCGNGVVDFGEACDDGGSNGAPGERCDATCHLVSAGPLCGNGAVDAGEQCDDGASNGTPGDRCSAQCNELPPTTLERDRTGNPVCGVGWVVAGGHENAGRKRRTTGRCREGDPACDFGPSPGSCRFHVWACADAGDSDTLCPGGPITRVRVHGGKGARQSAAGADRRSLQTALAALPLPLASGQACTPRLDVTVSVGRPLGLRTATHTALGSVLRASLKLRCAGR
jgi:cysteine-rich repeat protein